MTPLLCCEQVDFSYGRLQVLFEVGFTVNAGDVIGLLGTNGAGKSTLLNVLSGFLRPSRGTTSFEGRDVTHVGVEERVRSGIVQVPGDRAVFGDLSVIDNLRCFGYTLDADRRATAGAIEVALDTFPQLRPRLGVRAASLSGGEQRMLGLCKALMLKPQVLLIDELTIGLAPTVIDSLLGVVRDINAGGTSVVLVEQSVNVALALVTRVYFMERGRIRFDGQAKDLLDREDLLRAMFLEGAARETLT